MTAPISGTPYTATTTATPQLDRGDQMGKDTFLKLLVAQLKYQDPSKPADATQFLAQTAQFTVVEKLEELSKQQTEMVTAQLMTSATSMIGRTVVYTGNDGKEYTGVVASTTIGSNPQLKVGNTDVALSQVKEVRPTTKP